MLEQATVQKLPNLADIPDQFHKPWNDYSVAQNIGGFGVIYNKSVIKDPPATWREFIDNVAAGKYGKRVSLLGSECRVEDAVRRVESQLKLG